MLLRESVNRFFHRDRWGHFLTEDIHEGIYNFIGRIGLERPVEK